MSTDSEPELTKKMRLRSPGVSSATRVASSNCLGCARRNGAQKSSSRNWAPTASAISLRPCPAETQNSPDDASMILSPRSFQQIHPFRADDHLRIGLEFAVRRERHPVFVERNALRLDLFLDREFGMAHRGLLRRGPRGSRERDARAAYARINFESYTFATRDAAPSAPFGGVPGRNPRPS